MTHKSLNLKINETSEIVHLVCVEVTKTSIRGFRAASKETNTAFQALCSFEREEVTILEETPFTLPPLPY